MTRPMVADNISLNCQYMPTNNVITNNIKISYNNINMPIKLDGISYY